MSRSLDELYDSSPLFGANAPYVEDLYERFLSDPGPKACCATRR